MDAERIAELQTWSQEGCANSLVIIELLDEIKWLQAIASVLADNLAHYRGRTVPVVMRIAKAIVREGEVESDGAMFETIEQWERLAAAEAAEGE